MTAARRVGSAERDDRAANKNETNVVREVGSDDRDYVMDCASAVDRYSIAPLLALPVNIFAVTVTAFVRVD